MAKYRLRKRKWLNEDKESHGRIIVSVEDCKERNDRELDTKEGTYQRFPEMTFDIADCYRSISLDFSVSGKNTKRSVKKARMIAKAVTEFADALEKEAEQYEAYQKLFDAKKKRLAKEKKKKKKGKEKIEVIK